MSNQPFYSETTHNITVSVEPHFLSNHSEPENGTYVWAYQVNISNDGDAPVHLQERYWRIIDGVGRVHEVEGIGVVGETPVIEPGDEFSYTSGTPLDTPSGIMSGKYMMRSHDGEKFEVTIPAFSLDSPYQLASVH